MRTETSSGKLDTIVIGWGKGGKTLAGALARAGEKVAIVEQSAQMYGEPASTSAAYPPKH